MKKFICNNKLQLMINKQFLVQIKNRPNRFRSVHRRTDNTTAKRKRTKHTHKIKDRITPLRSSNPN